MTKQSDVLSVQTARRINVQLSKSHKRISKFVCNLSGVNIGSHILEISRSAVTPSLPKDIEQVTLTLNSGDELTRLLYQKQSVACACDFGRGFAVIAKAQIQSD